jgi:putative cell wall-binding protein
MAAVAVVVAVIAPSTALAADEDASLSGVFTRAGGGVVGSCGRVNLYPHGHSDGPALATAATSIDGSYAISGLAPGAYDVLFNWACTGGEPTIGEWGDGTHGAHQQTPTPLVSGENVLDAHLEAGGRITGSLTGSGSPIGGTITLTAVDPILPGPAQRVVVSQGTIGSSPIRPGRYVLTITATGWVTADHGGVQTLTPTSEPLEVGLGETVSVDVDLAPAGQISGTVTLRAADGSTSPLAGARIALTDVDTGLRRSASADEAGRYVVRGLDGRFRISFSADSPVLTEYLGGSRDPASSTIVEVRDNAVIAGQDAELDLGGTFTGWPRYRPAPGAEPVSVPGWETVFQIARFDVESGRFVEPTEFRWNSPIGGPPTSSAYPPGRYLITTMYTRYAPDPVWYYDEREVVLSADENTDIGSYLLGTRTWDVGRIFGLDRYATSAAISAATFGTGVPIAFLANGANFPDALSGAAVAGALGGPVLLTPTGSLPAVTRSELLRLAPAKVVLLGGPGSLSPEVLRQAQALAPVVERYGGRDRFETSASISRESFPDGASTVFIANAYNFPDALSGAAAAGVLGAPVLLSPATGLAPAVEAELERLAPDEVFILGGTGALHDRVAAQAGRYADEVRRISGADRFETSAAISYAFFDEGVPVAFLANAYNFPDALSAAAAAGSLGGPVLLTPAARAPDVIFEEIIGLDPDRLEVLGGPAVVSNDTLREFQSALSHYRPRTAS